MKLADVLPMSMVLYKNYNELLKKVLTKHVWSNLCAVYVLGGNPKPINRIMSMGHASDNTRMAGLVPKLILGAVYKPVFDWTTE